MEKLIELLKSQWVSQQAIVGYYERQFPINNSTSLTYKELMDISDRLGQLVVQLERQHAKD